jgi:hypothetical protein
MVECHDAMYSMSGGRQGACSYHVMTASGGPSIAAKSFRQ